MTAATVCDHQSFCYKTDTNTVWERPNFYSSPAISQSLDESLRVSGLSKDEIDLFDFYS